MGPAWWLSLEFWSSFLLLERVNPLITIWSLDYQMPPTIKSYQPTHFQLQSFQSCAHPSFQMYPPQKISPWSCCFPRWSSGISLTSLTWKNWSHQCRDRCHHNFSSLQPPVCQWCFGKMGKLVVLSMLCLGWACCGSRGLMCIVHTFGGHNLGLQSCTPAQSICSIAQYRWPAEQSSQWINYFHFCNNLWIFS